jgi:hypothetical protein
MTPFAVLGKSAATKASVIKRLMQQLSLANQGPMGLSSLQLEAARMGRVGQTLKLDSALDKLNKMLSKHHPGFAADDMKRVAESGPLKMVHKNLL